VSEKVVGIEIDGGAELIELTPMIAGEVQLEAPQRAGDDRKRLEGGRFLDLGRRIRQSVLHGEKESMPLVRRRAAAQLARA
jgi:hypothetical protein